jgi:hypothetical protein
MIREDDETREIFVFGAEPVGHPAADAGMSGQDGAGVHLEQRRTVRGAQRVHRANQRDVVDVLRDVREQLRDFHAALAVLLERPRRRQEAARRAHDRLHFAHARHRLALVLEQGRLGIEGVDLADAAVAED